MAKSKRPRPQPGGETADAKPGKRHATHSPANLPSATDAAPKPGRYQVPSYAELTVPLRLPTQVVGKRVEVFWAGDGGAAGKWHGATVMRHDHAQNALLLLYDDMQLDPRAGKESAWEWEPALAASVRIAQHQEPPRRTRHTGLKAAEPAPGEAGHREWELDASGNWRGSLLAPEELRRKEEEAAAAEQAVVHTAQEGKEAAAAAKEAERTRPLNLNECQLETLADERSVGRYVAVYWPAHNLWYDGEVLAYDPAGRKHQIIYADGKKEWHARLPSRARFLSDNRAGDASLHQSWAAARRDAAVETIKQQTQASEASRRGDGRRSGGSGGSGKGRGNGKVVLDAKRFPARLAPSGYRPPEDTVSSATSARGSSSGGSTQRNGSSSSSSSGASSSSGNGKASASASSKLSSGKRERAARQSSSSSSSGPPANARPYRVWVKGVGWKRTKESASSDRASAKSSDAKARADNGAKVNSKPASRSHRAKPVEDTPPNPARQSEWAVSVVGGAVKVDDGALVKALLPLLGMTSCDPAPIVAILKKAARLAKKIPLALAGGLARTAIESALRAPDLRTTKAMARNLLQSQCDDGTMLIGRRVRIFWPGDADWYAGTVTYFDPENMLHKVDYDDGETYRHDLSEAGWRVVGSPLPRVPAARRSTGGNGGVAKSQAET